MKALWNGKTIAESDETIVIEGNHYFPRKSVNDEFLQDSDMHTTCPWKGEASYYDIKVGDEVNEGAAWYYPEPKDGSIPIAGHDFANYMAFWRGVEVTE